MILGWRDLIRSKLFSRRHEFVSVDAKRGTNDPRTYEMLDSAKNASGLNISTPDRILSPGQSHPLRSSPMTPEPDAKEHDYFANKAVYRSSDMISPQTPAPAYSSPRSPNPYIGREWDPRATQARPAYLPGTAMSKDYS